MIQYQHLLSRRGIYAAGALVFVTVVLFLSRDSSLLHSKPPALEIFDSLHDVYNGTAGFGHIFVIGLPARSDRRDGMALAAGLSHLSIEFVDGVNSTEILEKAIPSTEDGKHATDGALGAWRGHMNAIQEIVVRNLSTALIMEDDMDWDIRIKDQLLDVARSTRVLIQPLKGTHSSYADPSFPHDTAKKPDTVTNFKLNDLPATNIPLLSPYGDDWDVLWLGHCGMNFPSKDNKRISRGRVVHNRDNTVLTKNYIEGLAGLKEEYPAHTRVVHHSEDGLCSLGYAVSQRGAQKMLLELALKPVDTSFDLMLKGFCGGERGGENHICLGIQPSLFHHHRPAGSANGESDISPHGDSYRKEAMTDSVRWSVRLNALELLRGGTNFIDSYPDKS